MLRVRRGHASKLDFSFVLCVSEALPSGHETEPPPCGGRMRRARNREHNSERNREQMDRRERPRETIDGEPHT
eukprot:138473-Prorocentrum_minimum.AAC.1